MALSAGNDQNQTTSRILNKLQYAMTDVAADITTATTSDIVLMLDASDNYEPKYADSANVFELMGVTATAAEINAVADVSGRLVTLTGDTTITEATHAGRTMLLGEVGGNALLTVTLPAATGTGNKYRFVVSVVNTSNYVIAVADATDIMYGNIFTSSTGDTPDLGQPWTTAADSDTITLNGTTTGGVAIGDWIELQDILTNGWAVTGITTTSGTEATPFSATIA